MINREIIRLAACTNNVGLKNEYSHKTSLKNSLCGDKITIEILIKNTKVKSIKYETEACIFCEASASLLSHNIKSINIKDIKNDFIKLKGISRKKNMKLPKKYSNFKKLLNSDNNNRFKCIFLPFDAVVKALKL